MRLAPFGDRSIKKNIFLFHFFLASNPGPPKVIETMPCLPINQFTNHIQIYGFFFLGGLVTSYSISLFIMNTFQYLESNLHTLVVAILGKPRESSQVVNNKNCLNILIQLVKRTSEKVSYHCHARGKMLWVVNTWQTTGIYYNTHGKWTAARDISYLVMTS